MTPPHEVVLSDHDGSFESFYVSHHGRVVALGYTLTGSRTAAEELAQDAFLDAYRRWDRISRYDRPDAWVRRVVANRAVSRLRRAGREAAAMSRLRSQAPAPAFDVSPPDERFWRAVRRLPRRQAQCVALHYLEDRPGRRRRRLVAVTAVALVALGIGGALQLTSDDAADQGVASGALPVYTPGWVPRGLDTRLAITTEAPDELIVDSRVTIYGDPSGDHPLRGSVLVALPVNEPDPSAASEGPSQVPLPVGDATGYVGEVGGETILTAPLSAGGWAGFNSAELSIDALVDAAEAATIEDEVVRVPPAALPEGWQLLAEDHLSAFFPMESALLLPGVGSSVVLQIPSPGENVPLVAVATGPGETARSEALWAFLEDPESAEIAGKEVILGKVDVPGGDDYPDIRAATWREPGSVIVRVTTVGLTAGELRRVIEGVEDINREELDVLLDRTAASREDSVTAEEPMPAGPSPTSVP